MPNILRSLNIKKLLLLLLTVLVFTYGCKAAVPIKVVEPTANESLRELDEYLDMIITTTEDFQASTLNMLIEEYFEEEDRLLQKRYGYHEKLKKLFDAGRIKEAPEEPRADHSTLISKLQSLSARYPTKATMEGVNYSIGYALFESGRYDEAAAAFEGFLKQYPSSRHALEVSFRLGEMYFEEMRLIEAEEAYARVLINPKSVFYNKALYKVGWTHYRLDEFHEAVDYFLRLLEDPPKKRKQNNGFSEASNDAIKEEAFDNIVKSLTHMQIPVEVSRELKKIEDTQIAQRLTLSLGKVLTEQTRHKEALKVYSLFEELFEDSKHRARVYAMRGVTHKKLGQNTLAGGIDKIIVKLFNPATEWYTTHFSEEETEAKTSTDAIVSDILMAMATEDHDKARRTKSDALLEGAIIKYRRHVEYFPVSDSSKKARLLLAEALFDAKRYDEATAMNERIIALYETSPEAEAAAMNVLSGIELSIKTPEGYDRAATLKTILTTETLFRKKHKDNTKLEGLLYRIAALYTDLKEYDKAQVVLSELSEGQHPARAYKMLGDIFVWENKETEAIEAYDRAIGYGTNVEVEKKLSEMYYVMALRLEKEGHDNEALTHYFKASSTMVGSRQAKDALKRGGGIYIKRRDLKGLHTIIDMLVKDYPASREPFGLLVEAGKGFEEDKNILQAATLFEEAADMASANSPFDSGRLVFKAAEILSDAGENKRLAEMLKRQLSGEGIAQGSMQRAMYMLGQALIDDGQERAGLKRLKQSIEAGDKATPFALKARHTLADIRLEEYLLLRITAPFEKTLKKKESLMVELLNEYKAIVKGGSAELLAKGFYSIGLLFEDFRTALTDSERPKGLTQTELDEYNFLIEERAYPLEEEAVEAFKGSLKASLKDSGTNALTVRAVKKLSLLRPALYRRPIVESSKPVRPIFIEPVMVQPSEFSTENNSAIEHFLRGSELLEKHTDANSLEATAILREAVKSFTLAIALEPDFGEARYGLGLTLFKLGDLGAAKRELLLSIKTAVKIPEAYNALAIIYVKEDNMKEAMNSLTYAIALKPGIEYMINLGNTYLLQGESDYALAQYRRAEEIDPNDPRLNYNTALTLLKGGHADEALSRLEQAGSLKAVSTDAAARIEAAYAEALVGKGRVKEALISYTAQATKNPALAAPNKSIAVIYEIYLENFDMAIVHYLKYIALGGSDGDMVRKWVDIARERGRAR